MLRRSFGCLSLILIAVSIGTAAESITDPTSNPQETWHYGTGMNNQTVTFSYDNGCSAYTIKIVKRSDPSDEIFSTGYGAPPRRIPSRRISPSRTPVRHLTRLR